MRPSPQRGIIVARSHLVETGAGGAAVQVASGVLPGVGDRSRLLVGVAKGIVDVGVDQVALAVRQAQNRALLSIAALSFLACFSLQRKLRE